MRNWSALALGLVLAGCVAYPRSYWTVKQGQARVDDGRPVVIKAQLIRDCESLEGEDTETVLRTYQTTTDAQGRYRLPIHAVTWDHRSLTTGAGCATHIQMYVCRPECIAADDIDINVLGK